MENKTKTYMTRKSFNLLIFALAAIIFSGCRSDVNLDPDSLTIDSQAQVKLSLPIGEISTSFADMIGLITQDANVVINDQDIIELRMKEHYENEFHKIELTDYIGTVESDITLQSVSPALTLLPANTQVDIPFDLEVTFDGVNDNTSDERIDSMAIELAKFTTKISKSPDLNITDNDIQSVTMELGSMFRRAKGNSIQLPNFRLNTDIPIEIDHFTLNMMKDETVEPSNANVINTAAIRFVMKLKTGENVIVTPASGFHFSFKVEMMSYSALYGYFEPGNETKDGDAVKVPITVGEGFNAILPVQHPLIYLLFTHSLSMPLDVNINYIKAIHRDESETFAHWGGSTSTKIPLANVLPISAPLDATVTDTIELSSDPDKGQIEKFFEKEVTHMGYDYKLGVDKQRVVNGKVMNQYRMTQNTKFAMDFEFYMPFEFNRGLDVSFGDTIKDVSLEAASLDSLAAKSNGVIKEVQDAQICLYLTIKNDIPVSLILDAIFLDEEKNEIKEIDQLKQIEIDGAAMVDGQPQEGKEKVIAVAIPKDDFEKMSNTRHIYFRMQVGDKQGESVFYASKKLSIKMGVTADIQALINMGALFKK